MDDTYRTIRDLSEGYYTEKRSRFLSFALPVRTPDEVKTQVDAYRKKYYDARHVCWAYMLGPDRTTFRANDDGEPSSTAGKPILGQINSHNLTDILIIVVRYFGGIKLGAGGLIRAYAHAAGLGLDAAAKVRMAPLQTMYVQIDYDLLAATERYLRDTEMRTEEAAYADVVTLALLVPTDDIELHQRALTDLTAGRARYRLGERRYVALPLA